jgi:ABC-2 type transport system permease protein
MSAVILIARRELAAYFKSPLGWVIVSILLFLTGAAFQGLVLGQGEQLSSDVLRGFFWWAFGLIGCFGGVLLSMRLFSTEQKDETLVLLYTAPISEWQMVLGKWLSAWIFLLLVTALTIYMPLMVAKNGSVSPGHLVAGYLGLALVAAAVTAIGTFASTLTSNQLVAGLVGGALVMMLVGSWFLAKRADAPLDDVFSYMSMYNKHFQPFAKGTIHTRSIVYYGSVTFFALVLARVVLGARRWR